MQNRYVGDVGDFANDGLLRWLTGMWDGGKNVVPDHRTRLAIVWYFRFPDQKEKNKKEGVITKYQKLCECDRKLYKELQKLMRRYRSKSLRTYELYKVESEKHKSVRTYKRNTVTERKSRPPRANKNKFVKVKRRPLVGVYRRNVRCLRQSGILPISKTGKLSFEEGMSSKNGASLLTTKQARDLWIERALKTIEEANLVFVNPDIGLAVDPKPSQDVEKGIKKISPYVDYGNKYAFMEDLKSFADKDRSLVIYHHLSYRAHTEQIRYWYRELQSAFPCAHIWALRFHFKGPQRAYFIICQTPEHRRILGERLTRFFNSPWAKQFIPFDCTLLQSPDQCKP